MRLVIWDLDGTLVDSQAEILGAMAAAFADQDLPLPGRAEVLAIVGLSLPEAFARLCPDLTPARHDRLVAAYKAAFAARRDRHGAAAGSPLFPGIRAVLDHLAGQAGTAMALATGKSRRGLEAVIEGHGLSGMFASRHCADDHPSKPHPAMLLATLADTGVAPSRAVMVGDTVFDMDMARAAGVRALGVGWGYHPARDLQGDGLALAPADLPAAIDRLVGAAP